MSLIFIVDIINWSMTAVVVWMMCGIGYHTGLFVWSFLCMIGRSSKLLWTGKPMELVEVVEPNDHIFIHVDPSTFTGHRFTGGKQ